jgi:hypothetical protein
VTSKEAPLCFVVASEVIENIRGAFLGQFERHSNNLIVGNFGSGAEADRLLGRIVRVSDVGDCFPYVLYSVREVGNDNIIDDAYGISKVTA